jgi:hypothetical protein
MEFIELFVNLVPELANWMALRNMGALLKCHQKR